MTEMRAGRHPVAYAVMVLTPLFFSSNLIFGRGIVDEVAPFTLALIRWLAVAMALSPFLWWERRALLPLLASHWRLILMLAFLGMWICGAGVYLALGHTTATNGTLIYTTSPVIIILLEAIFFRRHIGWREAIGSVIAFVGVATIVLRGDLGAIAGLGANLGDLLFVAAAIAWASYSILYRNSGLAGLSTMALLALIAAAGVVLLLPVAILEWLSGAPMPVTATTWSGIAGIVVFASLLAFSGFQFGVRRLGAPTAGLFMYLLPPYGVALAVLFLGERLETFHFAGIALVMSGIVLATAPLDLLRSRLRGFEARR